MDEKQSIYAEMLINKILGHGLINSLTPQTDLFENGLQHQPIPITQPASINVPSLINYSQSLNTEPIYNLDCQYLHTSQQPSKYISTFSEVLNSLKKNQYLFNFFIHFMFLLSQVG